MCTCNRSVAFKSHIILDIFHTEHVTGTPTIYVTRIVDVGEVAAVAAWMILILLLKIISPLKNKHFLGGGGELDSKKEIYNGLVCFIYRRFTNCVRNEEIRSIPSIAVQTKFR